MICKCKRCGRGVVIRALKDSYNSGVLAWSDIPAQWTVESARFSNSHIGPLIVDVDAVPVSSVVELGRRGEIPQDGDAGRRLAQYLYGILFNDRQ